MPNKIKIFRGWEQKLKKKKKNITYLPNKMTRKCMEVSTEDRSGKFENHLEAMLLDVLNGVTVDFIIGSML